MIVFNPSKILQKSEVWAVLGYFTKQRKKRPGPHLNLIIFRLSCCCGLRASEICGLNVGDIQLAGPRPCISVRKAIVKGKNRSRTIPLWWDKGTLLDLIDWMDLRVNKMGAKASDPFVCSLRRPYRGGRMTREKALGRWHSALKALSPERRKQLSIHCGRHSFCTHTLDSGRSIVQVRDAAGHSNIATTSIYLHYLEKENLPDIYEPPPEDPK